MAGIVIISNAANEVRQVGETTASWLLRSEMYQRSLRGEFTGYGDWDKLKIDHHGSDYSDMRFMQGGIPPNNLVLKADNTFIEFVNAKIRVTKQNTIVETSMVNRNGTIKEYINAKDYVVDITGDIMTSDNIYPVREIEKIDKYLSEKKVLDVVNVFLDAFKISKVVFKDGDFDQQKQSFFNVLPFKFQFISDEDSDNAYGLTMDN
jgi:hypothetical protein